MRRPLARIVLLTITCIGVAGMFLYKFKYEQMKSIVEGAGLQAVIYRSYNLLPANLNSDSKQITFASPLISWKNLSSVFLYSAFPCDSSHDQNSDAWDFCSIGFGSPLVPNYECSIWFDLGKQLESVEGVLSHKEIEVKGSANSIFEFKCSVRNLRPFHQNPYVFVIKTHEPQNKVIIPIFYKKETARDKLALCVYPDIEGNQWSSIVEFFAFHDSSGFTDLIIYDNGINFGFLDKVKAVTRDSYSFKSVTTLLWDFPFNDPASNKLVEMDCALRTSFYSKMAIVLSWNQLAVPNSESTLNSKLKSKSVTDRVKIQLPTKRCCTDSFDDRRSEKTWPVILRKTQCIPHSETHVVYIHADDVFSVTESTELLTYEECGGLSDSGIVPDFSVWNYSSQILASNLLLSWDQDKLFLVVP